MLHGAEFFCAGALIVVAAASWLAYSGDSRRQYVTGKMKRIPGVRGGHKTIKLSFYATIAVTGFTLFTPDAPGLLVMWRSDATLIIGAIIALLGEALFLAAKISLGLNYSPCYDSYVPASVTTRGVYKISRHPVYVGNSIVFCGALVASGSIWVLAQLLLMLGLYARTIVIEESHLASVPGYSEYRRRTPLLIGIPCLLRHVFHDRAGGSNT